MGPQLTKLNLVKLVLNINLVDFMELFQVHVEELDNQALIILSQNTPNLRLLNQQIQSKENELLTNMHIHNQEPQLLQLWVC